MSKTYLKTRNRLLAEALMNSSFYKNKNNFILKEYEPGEAAARAGAQLAGLPKNVYDNKQITDSNTLFDIVNGFLDIVGIFDPSGIADGTNALLYAARGMWADVIFSIIGAIVPYAGDTLKGLKLGKKIPKEIYQAVERTVNSGIMEKFSKFLSDKGYKNVSEMINYMKKMDAKQIEEYIDYVYKQQNKTIGKRVIETVDKKMVESTTAFTLKGQKAAWKANPIAKSIEYGLAGVVGHGKVSSFTDKQKLAVAEKYTRDVVCRSDPEEQEFCNTLKTNPSDLSVISVSDKPEEMKKYDIYAYTELRKQNIEKALKWFEQGKL
jgi:hypothetical protein